MQTPNVKSDELEAALRKLKRGLMSTDEPVALAAYKQLYEAGSRAAPILERELAKFPFETSPKHPEAMKLLAGLLAMQRDIDETASDCLIDTALARRCPDVVSALLRSVRRISKNEFRRAAAGSIEVWEHLSLDCRYNASLRVREWLEELPESERDGISRIVIVPHSLEKDWMGSYLPILGVVTLAWMTFLPPESRLIRIINANHQFTLFHEIGHHVHRHSFGQDPEQENEANVYAFRVTARGRSPWMHPILTLLSMLSRLQGRCKQLHPFA